MQYDQNLKNMSEKPEEYFVQTRPEMMKFIPKDSNTILDVGCGRGLFGNQLKHKFNAKVWGIEIDEKEGEQAKEKIDKVFIGDVVKLINEIPDKYFDCIVFNDVLEHLVDPYNLLLKIKTKLKVNGVIICSIPNVRYFFNLKNLMIKKQWKYEDAGILDKTHLRFFTEKSIKDMFKNLNYELIKLEGINPIKSWKFSLLNILSFGFLSDTKFMQFACAAKPKS